MGQINRNIVFGIRPYLRGIMQNREAYNFGFRLAEHFNEPHRTKEEAEMDSILMNDKAVSFINNLIDEIEKEDI
jgi:hypothetical protein